MSVTRRIAAVVGFVLVLGFSAAVPAGAATPAAAQVGPSDLSYHYRYELWVENAHDAEDLAWTVASRLTAYFPFDSNCRSLPPIGGRCELYSIPDLSLLGTTNPVMVVDRSPISWTFKSMPGHVEGAGRYITFAFVEGRYGYELDVRSWGPFTLTASLTVSSGTAHTVWQRFADNISTFL